MIGSPSIEDVVVIPGENPREPCETSGGINLRPTLRVQPDIGSDHLAGEAGWSFGLDPLLEGHLLMCAEFGHGFPEAIGVDLVSAANEEVVAAGQVGLRRRQSSLVFIEELPPEHVEIRDFR